MREIRRVLTPGGTYLHCAESAVGNDAAVAFDRAWRAILDRAGFPQEWYSNVSPDDCSRELRDQGAAIESVVAAEWTTARPVNDYLDDYRNRLRVLYAHIPDSVYAAAIADLVQWAAATLAPHEPIGYTFRFAIDAVRDWAPGK